MWLYFNTLWPTTLLLLTISFGHAFFYLNQMIYDDFITEPDKNTRFHNDFDSRSANLINI